MNQDKTTTFDQDLKTRKHTRTVLYYSMLGLMGIALAYTVAIIAVSV